MAKHQSVWITTSERSNFGVLEEPIDVAVVGGGIAGLLTGLLLKNVGLRMAALEAGAVCCATTGHTTAKVSAQHGLTYDTLRSSFGEEGARAYGDALHRQAQARLTAPLRRHGLQEVGHDERDHRGSRDQVRAAQVRAVRRHGVQRSLAVSRDRDLLGVGAEVT